MRHSPVELPGQSSLLLAAGERGSGEDLARRVRLLAGSNAPAALHDALQLELSRIKEAYEADPTAWISWADGIDVLGDAFQELVPGAARRAAGQFLTPHWAADLMGAWLLREETKILCDPAVGTGRLLYRAAQRPEPGPNELIGFDIDQSCLTMAGFNLLVRALENYRLDRRDFLLDPIDVTPDAVICNPPYCRHHAIHPSDKAAIHEGFRKRLGLRLNRLAGLHVLFLVRALEIAAPGARLAFITPAEWLDVNYGRQVKQFVLEQARVEALVILKDDHLFFDGALTTAAITLLRKSRGGAEASRSTRILHLPAELPEVDVVLDALNGGGDLHVDEVALDASQRWSRKTATKRGGQPLGELARVRRGIATGCNRFFVISEATRREYDLPLDDLRPCITSPRLIDGLELTGSDLDALDDQIPKWALECRDPEAEESDTSLGRYLRWGREELRAHAGYLASKRRPWYALERRALSPILFTYMNRQRPRFVRNRAGAVPLNTFLIVEPRTGVDVEALWKALNREEFLRQLQDERRAYGGGLWKIEPKELETVPLSMRFAT